MDPGVRVAPVVRVAVQHIVDRAEEVERALGDPVEVHLVADSLAT